MLDKSEENDRNIKKPHTKHEEFFRMPHRQIFSTGELERLVLEIKEKNIIERAGMDFPS